MGLSDLSKAPGQALGDMVQLGSIESVIQWGRSYSLWPYPFATACCGIEYMSTACSDYDIARFGAERPSFSPRQADMILVLGTITYKMAPVLRQIYDQMAEPKFVISVGACASSGGMFHTYGVLQGVDRILPVDIYVPGCPPRPEAILDALLKLQAKLKTQGLEARRQEVMQKIQELNERNKPLVVR
ncbi:NADH-quinone oxidoreductase subunit B [Leptospira kmetyi]|uniref:NADH-quinone oxidoreductase subunit B n=1 Tax=Leptospira kmetyi TaxID=408139 RepID=A0A2M9XL92_9LEPT|nr:NADH-quinone oxidoreductase subunit B [Leptospira kmetyi]AYV55104.1 NADH-quinone oxidoreductase subunit B [Leptospira kmetyi]EQA54147.1 NADH-quinone oxidoreductase, B subunit [Leptospira kmetyi serovar Malaysia str. Bejo-Iso9]PJZ30298.1 NADH-quinone oxidoreductase subunit B [Leptospira kmetyi]PJZ40070.1 NADH-quinone oxidoreductase subunit B [Leptospira kmetyi]TGK19486.1 NADH-quinone oxidoreductase subunit B [Leptospira kmetyi]